MIETPIDIDSVSITPPHDSNWVNYSSIIYKWKVLFIPILSFDAVT
jgi:hypothetical protein